MKPAIYEDFGPLGMHIDRPVVAERGIGAISGVQLAGGGVEFVWRRCQGSLI